MSDWQSLSDDELRVRLVARLGHGQGQDVDRLVRHRDDEATVVIIDAVLGETS